jgi:hypothetical protein
MDNTYQLKQLTSRATKACARSGIDVSSSPLLAAPTTGCGRDLGPALDTIESSLKLEFG